MGLFSRTLSRIDEIKKSITREAGPRQFLAVADEHRRQGRPREAIEILESGLAQSPASVAGHVALGRLLQQTEQLDKALASFHAALKLDPQNLVALRQIADVHLTRGEKVEAIKRLKLFRGLSPGDREVSELIRQLDAELAPPPSPRSGLPAPVRTPRPDSKSDLSSQPLDVARTAGTAPEGLAQGDAGGRPAPPPPAPPVASIAEPAPEAEPPRPAVTAALGEPQVEPTPGDAGAEAAAWTGPAPGAPREAPVLGPPSAAGPFEASPARSEVEPPEEVGSREAVSSAPVPADPAAPVAEPPPVEAVPPRQEPPPVPPLPVPGATETLAGLLRAQGHLGRARDAYLELARSEPDEARARRFRGIADEIASSRASTVRGRLETWAEPFSRNRVPVEGDLVTAVEEAVEKLAPAAALVTDLEGVPVVTVGPRGEAEAMESLSAELTAFWKNVRRARAEVGEGALRSLVLTGSAGTAAVQAITPEYALLLKTGPGVPAGRIRFVAARAADQLRPALV